MSAPRAKKTSSNSARRRANADRPILWIIAAANGSGKSAVYANHRFEDRTGAVWIINPDLLAARIADAERRPLGPANVEAVERIEKWLYASVEAYQTVGVETVLSTDKYRRLVREARSKGFVFKFHYVYLRSHELNIERVKARVAKGGHAVPEDKIVSRRTKSLAQSPWFLAASDEAYVFDNSDAQPRLAVIKRKNAVAIGPKGAIAEIREAAIAEGKRLTAKA